MSNMTEAERNELLTSVKQRIRDGKGWRMPGAPKLVPKAPTVNRVFIVEDADKRRFAQVAISFEEARRIFNTANLV